MEYVIIGSGIAGMSAAKTIRQHDQVGGITLFTNEFHPVGCYARKDLARRLMAELAEPEDLLTETPAELAEQNIRVVYEDIARVLPHMNQVLYGHYARKNYDRLLIASGSIPRLVDADGVHLIGVHQLRNYEDASLIEAWMPQLQQSGAVVIGGGILGIDAAYVLNYRGVPTTLVAREARLGIGHFSEAEATQVEERLKFEGVQVVLNATLEAYLSEDERVLDGVRLSNGRIIGARMALCAVGVRPSTGFLDESGIVLDEVSGGINVGSSMQTNFTEIYAAGGCASVDGIIASTWTQSAEQGRIAGLNMVGQSAAYSPEPATFTPLVLQASAQTA